jgi:hypothetical protein
MGMTAAELDARVRAVEKLTLIFKTERTIYLAITTISVLILLTCAGFLIKQQLGDMKVLIGLFGSSGLISYSLGRVLRMWDQALQVLNGQPGGGGS